MPPNRPPPPPNKRALFTYNKFKHFKTFQDKMSSKYTRKCIKFYLTKTKLTEGHVFELSAARVQIQ